MRGAMARRGAYIPSLDLRVKHGLWRGISSDPNINSYQVGRNVYFYMSKSYKLAEAQQTHEKVVTMMAGHIIKLVNKEAQRLLNTGMIMSIYTLTDGHMEHDTAGVDTGAKVRNAAK